MALPRRMLLLHHLLIANVNPVVVTSKILRLERKLEPLRLLIS